MEKGSNWNDAERWKEDDRHGDGSTWKGNDDAGGKAKGRKGGQEKGQGQNNAGKGGGKDRGKSGRFGRDRPSGDDEWAALGRMRNAAAS